MPETKKKADGPVEIPCRYGNVSVGEETVSVTASISRSNLTPNKADALLCGRRLTMTLYCAPKGVDPDQKPLPGMDGVGRELEAVADVKKFGVGRKALTTRFTFALASVDLDSLCHFAKRDGKVTIKSVADLDDDRDEEETD